MYKQKPKLYLALILFLGIGVAAYYWWIERTNNLAKTFVSQMQEIAVNLGPGASVNLKIEGARKICIQPPYIEEKAFREAVGENGESFAVVKEDQQFIIHIYVEKNSHSQAAVAGNNIRLDYSTNSPACKITQSVMLHRKDNFVMFSF